MSFLETLHKLPSGEQTKVLKKTKQLEESAESNGKSQIQLHGFDPIPPPPGLIPHRAHAANHYRILYAFNANQVYLLGVYKKKDIGNDYKKVVADVDEIPKPSLEIEDTLLDLASKTPEPESFQLEEDSLDQKITQQQFSPLFTEEVLNRFNTPNDLKQKLLEITDTDELFELSEENPNWDALILQLDEYLDSPTDPLSPFKFPDVQDAWETIEKIVSGELSPEDLNLKLSDEQEELVNFAFERDGAVLIKGAAGTGKSLVAHRRVQSYLNHLSGQLDYVNKKPRILYTTFTNALVNDSLKNLKNILGKDDFKKCLETGTIHSVIKETYLECQKILNNRNFFDRVRGNLRKIQNIDPICISPNTRNYLPLLIETLHQRYDEKPKADAARYFFDRIGVDYLTDEIEFLIYGNQINTREKYLKFIRKGRKLPLQENQRNFIWDIKIALEEKTLREKRLTWKQLAPATLALLQAIKKDSPDLFNELNTFDAIVVDEGQDLTPMELRVLSELIPSPNRLFVVADSAQAIHQPASLNLQESTEIDFQGRTRELKTNYRSTQQIADASSSFLHAFDLENETETTEFYYSGPKPRLWKIAGSEETQLENEMSAITDELRRIANKKGNQLSNIAIFSSSERKCKEIQTHLNKMDIPSRFCNSRTYEKSQKNQVTIMSLKSIKGLEFPIVYIAGLSDNFPRNIDVELGEVAEENIERGVRDLFVGMTRAIQVLTLCIPENSDNSLFKSQNFQSYLWEISKK